MAHLSKVALENLRVASSYNSLKVGLLSLSHPMCTRYSIFTFFQLECEYPPWAEPCMMSIKPRRCVS